MVKGWENELLVMLDDQKLLLDVESLEKLSKDYYWYSPVLDRQLKEKLADGIALPVNEKEVVLILTFAYHHQIPITVRGAGTGNYGQAVPLNGGIVLDLSRLDQIVEMGEGFVRAQAGVRMGLLDKKAREVGQELRIYPSTIAKATIGGFISGGSGGVGSIEWGNLWDGNVMEAVIYTMEEIPQRLVVSGDELLNYIHNYGTTGVMTEVKIPLATRTEWMQSIAQFDHFDQAVQFGESLARSVTIKRRLITPIEWPLPSFFIPLTKVLEKNSACVLLETEDNSLEELQRMAGDFGGRIGHVVAASDYRKTIGLSDFTWNHTTLWALKADPSYTYLQSAFLLDSYMDQIHQIKQKYGDEVLMHFEWVKGGGKLVPSALPVIKYVSEERLYEIIRFFESIGAKIFDPHTYVLDSGSRNAVSGMQRVKRKNDPLGLLNPGKIVIDAQKVNDGSMI
jgi:FAD/FMN-containing dehydrogenase